ncbi:MAG: methionine--tRNA ligase [Gemmatimonadetes bacterium]|nr:methionine--tRNA ligase [Gemmatimonadota bacterium]
MKGFYYLTTAIDYANGPPHIGHAFEKIGGDAVARYHRRKGENVHLVVGMDEHGLNVLQSAGAAGITPQQWVDDLAGQFLSAWQRLSISNDDFIRTTQPRHRRAVNVMIERMQRAGDLYRGTYEGYYCVRCEAYKAEEELSGEGGVAGLRCPLHPTREIVWMREENWFFRLSRYRDQLLQLLDQRPEFVQPEIRRNEIRRVLEEGLQDISVSRSRLPWGVPWPGEPDQTVYVWIDALTNYLSAVGFPDPGYTAFWPADLHVIGKDITRFHCIYWPAMLLSAGLELPGSVWAHGFLTYEGSKFSKSAGAWVDLDDAIGRYGPDALRYYLLREVPWAGDGDFSWSRFAERYTAELADDLGNLANRTITMIERYRGGRVPAGAATALDETAGAVLRRYTEAMDAHLLHQGAATAMELADAANVFIERRAPWRQAREGDQAAELDATLASLARTLGKLATLLEPFMPQKMAALGGWLGLEPLPQLDQLATLELAGRRVKRAEVLFPKWSSP